MRPSSAQQNNPHFVEDLLTTTFRGPYSLSAATPGDMAPAGDGRRQQLFVGLAQWWHAAKFGPKQPQLRDRVLASSTLRGAYLTAKKHQALWRSDWEVIRHGVLKCGLAMLALDRPELGLLGAPREAIALGLKPLRLPPSFTSATIDAFEMWRAGPRIAVFGAEAAPEQVVSKRMAKVVDNLDGWTLVLPSGRTVPWRLHDWALWLYQPVQFKGEMGKRFRREHASELIVHADLVIVFEHRGAKRFDHIIQDAKARKKKLTLELYDGGHEVGQQMAII